LSEQRYHQRKQRNAWNCLHHARKREHRKLQRLHPRNDDCQRQANQNSNSKRGKGQQKMIAEIVGKERELFCEFGFCQLHCCLDSDL
jgi:hypothetical protein